MFRSHDRSAPACVAGALLAALLPAGVARAGTSAVALSASTTTTTVDFEDQPVTDPSTYQSLALANGLLTLTSVDPQAFGFQDLSLLEIQGTAPFGTRTGQAEIFGDADPFTVNVAQPASAFSLQFGDASDTSDSLSLKAYSGPNGSGTLLASKTSTLVSSASQFNIATLGVSAAGIESVQFVGGPAGANGAFFDNFSVTTAASGSGSGSPSAVPLPAAALMFPFGAALAWYASRRLRASLTK